VAHLFISYARKDGADFSRRIKEDLKEHEAWLDESGIAGGESWTSVIEREIDACQALLAVLTIRYADSRVGGMEIQRAFRKGKLLIPLRLHADAETPLLLEGAEYYDFSSPERYPASLASLLRRIAPMPAGASVEVGVGQPASPQSAAPQNETAAVAARLEERVRRFVRENEGTTKAPGRFVRGLYVRRTAVEGTLSRFLAGPSKALIMVGETGTGKTNVLCRWALDLCEQGHLVLPYAADALADADIEREVARDLGIAADDLPRALTALDVQASASGKKLVVLFDSINEFTGSERDGARVLVRRINSFVSRLPGPGIRVLLSCSATTWNRLQRISPMRFDPECYFLVDDDPAIRLDRFSEGELEAAYALYEKGFELRWGLDALSKAVRDRLRHPLLLRLMAESYRGLDQPPAPANLELAIYQRFFSERVQTAAEYAFVDALADEMLRRQSSSLPLSELARHDELGRELLSEEPTSIYQRLLDRGVLQESQADLRAGPSVRFSYAGMAAYVLARRSRALREDDARTAAHLVAQAGRFPLAWEVARTALLLGRSPPAFEALAASRELELRELTVEALVALYAETPKETTALIDRLLAIDSEEARRTALKAAYNIGPPARDIFLHTALEGGPALRQSLKDTLYLIWRRDSPVGRRGAADNLYLIWRHDPGFTYGFLGEMLAKISLGNIAKIRPILEFVLDLSIVIYVNHCDRDDVAESTARLYHELATERLHLDLLNTGFLGVRFEKLVFRSVARVFSKRILQWMLFSDTVPADRFFELPKERRACLVRVADVLEPERSLEPLRTDLSAMLCGEVPLLRAAAGLALVVHAYRDFPSAQPLVLQLFDELDQTGRLWLLQGFSVLLPDTPPQWVGLLEGLTQRYLREHRDAFLAPPVNDPGSLDIVLLALGLAYGKQGTTMPVFDRLLKDASGGDQALFARGIAALGPVGFYYPQPVLDALPNLTGAAYGPDGGQAESALVSLLATMRTLHFDAVDQFLERAEAPEEMRHRIAANADVTLVHRYIHVLGYYNNAVHYIVRYPRMRRQLAMGALKLLAEAEDAAHFIGDYTAVAVGMFRSANFQLLEWTLPD
jgi:TIR domain